MQSANFVLEQVNGSVWLLTLFFLCWCSHYIWQYVVYRGMGWRAVFIGLPPAVGLVFIFYVEKVGTLLTRAVIWLGWPNITVGSLTSAQSIILFTGSGMTGVGLVLLIRMLSRPQFGEWPWMASVGVSGAYVLISSIVHLWG